MPAVVEVDAATERLRNWALLVLGIVYLLPAVYALPPNLNIVLTATLTVFTASLRTVGKTHEAEMLSQRVRRAQPTRCKLRDNTLASFPDQSERTRHWRDGPQADAAAQHACYCVATAHVWLPRVSKPCCGASKCDTSARLEQPACQSAPELSGRPAPRIVRMCSISCMWAITHSRFDLQRSPTSSQTMPRLHWLQKSRLLKGCEAQRRMLRNTTGCTPSARRCSCDRCKKALAALCRRRLTIRSLAVPRCWACSSPSASCQSTSSRTSSRSTSACSASLRLEVRPPTV